MPSILLKFHTYEFGTIISTWEKRQSIMVDSSEIPRRDGQIIIGGKQGIREYELKGTFFADTPSAVRTLYDDMMGVIAARTANLYLLEDRFVEARLVSYSDSFIEGSALCVLDFTLIFQSTLPYEQSATLQSTSYTCVGGGNETFTVTNAGNYPAFTLFTITAVGAVTQDCTITNSTNDQAFSYLGNIAAGKIVTVNSHVVPFTVLNDNVSDIANFSGNVIKLESGVNTIQVNSIAGTIIQVQHRDTYV